MARSLSAATKAAISRSLKGNKNAYRGGPKKRLTAREKVANINARTSSKKMNLTPEQIARRSAVAKRLRAQARREEAQGGRNEGVQASTVAKSTTPEVKAQARAREGKLTTVAEGNNDTQAQVKKLQDGTFDKMPGLSEQDSRLHAVAKLKGDSKLTSLLEKQAARANEPSAARVVNNNDAAKKTYPKAEGGRISRESAADIMFGTGNRSEKQRRAAEAQEPATAKQKSDAEALKQAMTFDSEGLRTKTEDALMAYLNSPEFEAQMVADSKLQNTKGRDRVRRSKNGSTTAGDPNRAPMSTRAARASSTAAARNRNEPTRAEREASVARRKAAQAKHEQQRRDQEARVAYQRRIREASIAAAARANEPRKPSDRSMSSRAYDASTGQSRNSPAIKKISGNGGNLLADAAREQQESATQRTAAPRAVPKKRTPKRPTAESRFSSEPEYEGLGNAQRRAYIRSRELGNSKRYSLFVAEKVEYDE